MSSPRFFFAVTTGLSENIEAQVKPETQHVSARYRRRLEHEADRGH